MRDWLSKVMAGRHGPDQLSQVMLFTGLILSLLSGLRNWHWLILPSYAALGYSMFRMFSRNNTRRWDENQKFINWWSKVRGQFQGSAERAKQSKEYRFFQCPKCGQRLRVPRGRGKLEITCPKCKEQFTKKT